MHLVIFGPCISLGLALRDWRSAEPFGCTVHYPLKDCHMELKSKLTKSIVYNMIHESVHRVVRPDPSGFGSTGKIMQTGQYDYRGCG